jgi:hypothetical protein
MGNNILEKTTQKKLVKVSGDEMKPFTEHPPAGILPGFPGAQNSAHKLFDLFTASIIREKKIFVR